MIICVHRTARATARAAARIVADAVERDPRAVLGLPTGKTSVPLYAELVALHRKARVDFTSVTTFNLDELWGLGPDDPRSYRAFMRRHFFRRVNLPPSHAHVPRGDAPDWRLEARRYESAIARSGGMDLCVLGIGRDGHIAFNEPAIRLERRTHLARLTPGTRRDNAEAFGGRWQMVPERALTVGMDVILNARHVLLVAVGRAKAGIVRRALRGPVSPRVPASYLQRHSSLTVLLDHAAAARLGWTRKP